MLVTQAQLAEATGYQPDQAARIEKCLRDQGIQFYYGRAGCIWTTTELIAQARAHTLTSAEHIKIDSNPHGKAA